MRFLIDFCAPQADPTAALRCAFGTPVEVLAAHQPDEVVPLLDRVDALARSGLWCVGYVAYEAASAFDPALTTHAPIGPLAWFGVHEKSLPWPTEPASGSAEVRWHNPLSRPRFDAAMASIHDAIAAGEFYQVNYTTRLHGSFQGEPPALFAALQRAQPKGYAAYLDTGSEHILSVSPELFFDWQGDVLGHIEMRQHMKGLEHKADFFAPQVRLFFVIQAANVHVVQHHRAGVPGVQASQAVEKGGLAHPRLAHDGDKFAGRHRE